MLRAVLGSTRLVGSPPLLVVSADFRWVLLSRLGIPSILQLLPPSPEETLELF